MESTVWLALLTLFLAGGLTPGPAVMLVVSSSLKHGFRAAMLPALGVSAANLIWISLAAGGVVALAAAIPAALTVLKLLGLGFIIWLAIGMARSGARDLRQDANATPLKRKLFASGVGLQLANPNALVFFGLLLPNYFDAERPLAAQVAVIMATVTVTEMFGLAVYAKLADAMARRFSNARFARRFNTGAALAMVVSAAYGLWSTL